VHVGGTGYSSRRFITSKVLNGFNNAQLPFHMVLEQSGLWHGVLMETSLPFIAQVVGAPGVMYHIEGTNPIVKLHFFIGPTQHQVLTQLHAHVS